MRIGFTFEKKQEILLRQKCDKVVVGVEGASVTKTFEKFVRKYLDDEIYLYRWDSSSMQLAQLYPAMTFLKENCKLLHFVEKVPRPQLSDLEFFNLLYDFALVEVGIMKERTEKGIALAKNQGLYPGRPTIAQKRIEKIQRLYQTKKKTFQEIAEECEVSVGTVHKYVVKLRETQQ